MAKCGRRPLLNEIKRREILAILAVGCSRSVAAEYVGCSPATIQNTAARSRQFAEDLRHAEHQAEISLQRNIQKAAAQEKYWRAAAWLLERKNPNDYARRPPGSLTREQVNAILAEIAAVVHEELNVAAHRKRILKRIGQVIGSLGVRGGGKPR